MQIGPLADISEKRLVRRSIMAKARYIVELTSEERSELQQLLRKGKVAAYKQRHARILLLADQGPSGKGRMSNSAIAKTVNCGTATVERIGKRFVLEGFQAALGRKNRTNYPRQIDGDAEAHLIALACSSPPEGRQRWTLRLLADKMVELQVVEHCSKDTIHRTLKKTNLSLG
jgi:transposase